MTAVAAAAGSKQLASRCHRGHRRGAATAATADTIAAIPFFFFFDLQIDRSGNRSEFDRKHRNLSGFHGFGAISERFGVIWRVFRKPKFLDFL